MAGNDLLAAFQNDTLTVSRAAVGTYTAADGSWTPGALTNITVNAIVTPLTAEEIVAQDLGEHVKEAVNVYTATALQPSDDARALQGDRFAWQGDTYEVVSVKHRGQIASLAHYQATATRVEGT